jgi:alpha-D-ribose 1-methylphosphonate 5-triphosphate synthase subunit PhnL
MANTLEIEGLAKTFRLHNQGRVEIAALGGIDLAVAPGECVVLSGPSGVGKSTVLRCVYGNYAVEVGHVSVRHGGMMVDIAGGHHRLILALRRRTIGYVSQFLRVVPRVATLDVVAEPALRAGLTREKARERAAELLDALAIPQRMWGLAPQTFSGGEQQRVNIARGFAFDYDLLLLDEPTASLDAANRQRVARLVDAAKARGAALLGIFHDADMAEAVGTRRFAMEAPQRAAA